MRRVCSTIRNGPDTAGASCCSVARSFPKRHVRCLHPGRTLHAFESPMPFVSCSCGILSGAVNRRRGGCPWPTRQSSARPARRTRRRRRPRARSGSSAQSGSLKRRRKAARRRQPPRTARRCPKRRAGTMLPGRKHLPKAGAPEGRPSRGSEEGRQKRLESTGLPLRALQKSRQAYVRNRLTSARRLLPVSVKRRLQSAAGCLALSSAHAARVSSWAFLTRSSWRTNSGAWKSCLGRSRTKRQHFAR